MLNPDFWKNRRVFITGATGLLGSHVLDELLARGAKVQALMRKEVERLPAEVDFFCADLQTSETFAGMLCHFKPQTILHLAAQAIVSEANENPTDTFQTNVRGTWELLEAARFTGLATGILPEVVVASSDKAYGKAERLPYEETMPLAATDPYGASKACADVLARTYAKTYGMKIAVTRCGNYFGPRDFHFSRLIPSLVRAALRRERPAIRSDGQTGRDYFYVKDGALATLLLAEALAKKNHTSTVTGEAFNFSYGEMRRTIDVANRILRKIGLEALTPSEIDRDVPRNEVRDQWLACDKAYAVLGWRPRYSFDLGLDETIAWYTEKFKAGALP